MPSRLPAPNGVTSTATRLLSQRHRIRQRRHPYRRNHVNRRVVPPIRPGVEAPWDIGRFCGTSYVVDPRGRILAEASEDRDELVIADLDMDMVREVRDLWQFFRDRRPETYGDLTEI